MIKILQILTSDSPGIQQLARSIESSFSNEYFKFTTAYLNPTSSKQVSTKAKYFNFNKKETKGLRLKALWQLFKYCRQEQFDVIITHRFKPLYLILIINKFLNVQKCISVIHGFDDFSRRYRYLILKLLWSKNWQFVAISGAVSNYLVRLNPSSYNRKITTINNAIDVDASTQSLKTKQQSRSALGFSEPLTIFGTVGRLIPLKGHIPLIKAFEAVLKKEANCHLIIIGEGRSRPEIENYLSRHNLQENVTLTGHLENAADYLKAFDVFVLPSLKEGFGMVLLEAMAAKLPIVASHTGGIPYVLGDLGTLVHPRDYPESLINAMLLKARSTPSERQEEGKALHSRLLKLFDKPIYQKKWAALINQREKQGG